VPDLALIVALPPGGQRLAQLLRLQCNDVNFVDLALLLHDTTPPGIQPTHLSRTT
jgi:hypothetical protein